MHEELEKPESIDYATFAQLDMRVATVLSAQVVEGADRLLCLVLDAGELGERTVVSGIREWYSPEELIGTQVIYLANLAPRKLKGVISQGMLLAAGAETAVLLQSRVPVAPGTPVR